MQKPGEAPRGSTRISEPGFGTTTGMETTGALVRTPSNADPALIEARAELRRQDDYYANERMKWGIRWFFVLWIGSLTIDAIVCFGLGLGSFTAAALHRLVPLPFVAWFARRIDRGPLVPEPQIYRALLLVNALTTVWLAMTVVSTGGMRSVFQTVVLFVPLTMIIVPTNFARSVVAFVVMLVSYVSTVLVGVALEPALRYQLRSSDAFIAFAFYVFAFVGMGSTMSVVSHLLWSLRREVFESKSIGKYSLRRLLGRGGMGEVWAAYHAGLRREVALKLLGVREGVSPVASRRFEREVQALVRLSHPNTVRVFDFGVADGGLLYYAMELLEGDNLGRLVRREGAMPVARARHFLLQASRALAEAHHRRIVHRDVKPENLFVTEAGGEGDFLKVLDFGIATLVEDDDHQKLTQTGTVAGTPGTVSPEVIRGEPATPAADVYALGAVGYLMLTGSLPFEADKVAAVMLAHLHDTPVAPSVRRGEPISPAFEAVIAKCLEKNPADRYRDAQALAIALAAIDDVPLWVPVRGSGPRSAPPEAGDAADSEAPSAPGRDEATRALPSMRPSRPPSTTPGDG